MGIVKMLIEIEPEQIIPEEMIIQIDCILDNIEGWKRLECLEQYQSEDLMYDLEMYRTAKTMFRHYTVYTEWDCLDIHSIEVDHDLTETETGLTFDEAYVLAGGDFEDV